MHVIGIVTALRTEASCVTQARIPFNKPIHIHDHAMLWLSGMGNDAAGLAAQRLLEQGATALVSFGVAGALDARLKPGDLVLPDAICAHTLLPVDHSWRDRLQQKLPNDIRIVNGIIANSDAALTDESAKQRLADASSACAVDMESAAIAHAAEQAHIPFLAVRAIIDPVQFSPPPVLLDAVYPDGSVNPLRLTALILKRSVRLSTLLQMSSAMHAARNTLTRVIQSAGIALSVD